MKARGITIAEFIVYVAVLSLVLVFMAPISEFSSRMFRSGRSTVEMQEGFNRGILRMTKDLQETNPISVRVRYTTTWGGGTVFEFPSLTPPPGTPHPATAPYYATSNPTAQLTTAIIMLSARDPTTSYRFDYSTGSPCTIGLACWHRWIGYYLEPRPNTSMGPYTLYRAEAPVSAALKISSRQAGGPPWYTSTPGTPIPVSGTWEDALRGFPGKTAIATNIVFFCLTNPFPGDPLYTADQQVYNNPYNFDAGGVTMSTVSFTSLRYMWLNISGMQYPNTQQFTSSRMSTQIVIRN